LDGLDLVILMSSGCEPAEGQGHEKRKKRKTREQEKRNEKKMI
jgi:hypothetical protein